MEWWKQVKRDDMRNALLLIEKDKERKNASTVLLLQRCCMPKGKHCINNHSFIFDAARKCKQNMRMLFPQCRMHFAAFWFGHIDRAGNHFNRGSWMDNIELLVSNILHTIASNVEICASIWAYFFRQSSHLNWSSQTDNIAFCASKINLQCHLFIGVFVIGKKFSIFFFNIGLKCSG